MATKGILGTKVGMTQIFDGSRAIPVTVVQAGPCHVTQVKTAATDGYDAVQLAFAAAPKVVSKPMKGHYAKAGAPAARHIVELRTDDAASYQPGQTVTVDVFQAGEIVDVVGVSKGQGFAGHIKRHNFKRGPKSHGSHNVRAPGSIGAAAYPARVFKGIRMAGHMGHEQVTTLNLEVVEADPERNIVLVKGSVPGPNGGVVIVRNAVKGKK